MFSPPRQPPAPRLIAHRRHLDTLRGRAPRLIARGITSPDHLGIYGRSNGGVLTSVSITQHPELFNAAVIESPLIDMLRYQELPAGASWMGEYGDPRIPGDADEEWALIEPVLQSLESNRSELGRAGRPRSNAPRQGWSDAMTRRTQGGVETRWGRDGKAHILRLEGDQLDDDLMERLVREIQALLDG